MTDGNKTFRDGADAYTKLEKGSKDQRVSKLVKVDAEIHQARPKALIDPELKKRIDVSNLDPISRPNKLKWGVGKIKAPFLDYKQRLKTLGVQSVSLPKEFDWRKKMASDGKPILLPVRDQGNCGSCYAFATVQMLANRLSIATNGKKRLNFSPQDMVACGPKFVQEVLDNPNPSESVKDLIKQDRFLAADFYALDACEGGLLTSAADYLVIKGIPTEDEVPYRELKQDGITASDDYYDRQDITRYFAYKAHSLTAGIEQGFPYEQIELPEAVLASNVENMQLAILNDGPILTGMNIYTDFNYYPYLGSIYEKQNHIIYDGEYIPVKMEGGHAVMIVGWGEGEDSEGNTVPYWIVQNTWSEDWGEDGGFFYIKRGVNMCNIEYESVAVFPDLDKSPFQTESSAKLEDDLPEGQKIGFIVGLVLAAVVVMAGVGLFGWTRWRRHKARAARSIKL